jgi:quercetin dioxygenase-like cupin family protein
LSNFEARQAFSFRGAEFGAIAEHMNVRTVSIALALLLVSRFVPADGVEKVRNEKVLVTEQTLAPGESRSLFAEHPSVLVYLEDGSVELTSAGKSARQSVKKGESVFQFAKAAMLKNAGTTPLHLVRVDYLGNGSSETWDTIGLAPGYKLLFENQYGRVYDIRIKAGTSEPMHTHHDRVVICLSGAPLRHEMPDGRTEVSTLKTGEIAWRHGGTHVGHNLGNTDLWVIAVEPK